VAEAQSVLRNLFPEYGARGSLTDDSNETPRTALLEQYGSIVEPYDPSLGEKIYNFAYDALGGNTATGLQKQRVQRWAGYPQKIIDQTALAGITDYSQAMQDYARGDALSGTANLAMAATSFIPGQQRQAVDEVIKRITDGSFGRTLIPFRSPISPQTDVPQIPFRSDTPTQGQSALRNLTDAPVTNPSALRTITGSQQIDAMAKNLNVPMIDRMLQPTGPVNRDMSLLERVGDVDRVNSMVVDELPGTLQPIPMVRAEDILNRPYVSTIVDTSDSSLGRIQAVNGIPVNDAVQYGGVYYGFQPENMDAGAIFANETVGATTTMLNKAKKAKDLPGAVGEPIFVPGGMMGKSIDYATMVPTLQIPYTSAVLSKKNKDLLDARIKRGKKNKKGEYIDGVPNWPGIDSPEALPFIGTIGGQRKNISTAIDEFAGDGAMSLSEARAIVTDPSQFTPLAGDLRAAYEIDMSRNPAVTKRHPAYGVDVYGRPLGAFGDGFNIFSMNPLYKEGVNFLDSQRAMGRTITPTYTKEVNPKTILGGMYGTFDQETVDAMVKSGFVAP
jgi:hypothetical protein